MTERRVADAIEAEKAQRPEARHDPRLDWWQRAYSRAQSGAVAGARAKTWDRVQMNGQTA